MAIAPVTEIVRLTPEDARKTLLDEGITFTSRQKLLISGYAKAIREGRWKLNGEPIILDTDGRLLDGKIRLAACVLANVAMPTFVVGGIDPSVGITIDTQRKRLTSDFLHIKGVDKGTELSATANAINYMVNRQLPVTKYTLKTDTAMDFIARTPELNRAIEAAESLGIKHGGVAFWAAFIFLTRTIDADKSHAFFEGLKQSLNGQKGNQPHAVLMRSINAMQDSGITPFRFRNFLQVYAVKAWNAHYEGATIPHLRWAENQEIPAMIGLEPGLVVVELTTSATEAEVKGSYIQAVHDTELSMTVRKISVQEAEGMLEANGPLLDGQNRNRRMSPGIVDVYARDMKSGNWKLNGQAIKISKSGHLLDGQHRLMAAIKADVALETMVVTGLDDEVFTTFDLHAKRLFTRTIAKLGYSNATIVQSALRIVWHREKYGLESSIHPTQSELNETLLRHGEHLVPSVKASMRAPVDPLSTRPVFAAMHYTFSASDAENAATFFKGLETGADLPEGSPLLVLRNKLIETRQNRRAASERDRLAFFTKGWNAYTKGKDTLFLKKGSPFEAPFDRPVPIEVPAKLKNGDVEEE